MKASAAGRLKRAQNFLITERGLKMSRHVARKQLLRKALAWVVSLVLVFTFYTMAFWLAAEGMSPAFEPGNAVYDTGVK